MSFQVWSKSPLVLPGMAWVSLPVALWLAFRRRDGLRQWGLVFALTTALDAWLNGALSPLPEASPWAPLVGVVFVILGDARLFVAIEWKAASSRRGHAVVRALGLSLVVPLLTQLARGLVPQVAATPRVTYLVYELLFLAWLLVLVKHRVAGWSSSSRAWALRLLLGFGVQYGLWVFADVVLLTTSRDVGYAMRLIPDFMYYALFVPWVLCQDAGEPAESR
jgi:hypothetical protein